MQYNFCSIQYFKDFIFKTTTIATIIMFLDTLVRYKTKEH